MLYFFQIKDELLKNQYLKCNNSDCEDGIVKPDIVFFGESLSEEFFIKVEEDFPKCDLLIIMGTSLKVQPFSLLTFAVPEECPRLLINRDAVGSDLLYDNPDVNYRDVFFQGDCDSGCLKLVKLLGWDDELDKLLSQNAQSNDAAISLEKNISNDKIWEYI